MPVAKHQHRRSVSMSQNPNMPLSLRATRSVDLPFVTAAEQHPANRPWVTPYTVAEHEALIGDPRFRHFVCESASGSQPVGFLLLAGIGSANRSIEFRRLIITEKGRGYGREAVRLVKDHAFTSLAAHRLWLDVVQENTGARALYASEGFSEEGVFREAHWTGSAFTSLVVMSILEHEFRAFR